MLNDRDRELFDEILDEQVAGLPNDLHDLLEEVPLIVEDEPSGQLLDELGLNRRQTDLCGLHWAVPLTEKSVWQTVEMPGRMMLFRGPIMRVAAQHSGGRWTHQELKRQIHITLLHEIGHHFGLGEADLQALGYG